MSLSELLEDKLLLATSTSEDEPSSKEDPVLVGEGLPPITPKVVQARERGDFVDLAHLLPKTPNWDDEVYTDVADQVILISKVKPRKRKTIQDLPTWVEAFCMFAAIKGKKFPKLIPDLMAYIATIVKAARDYWGKNWLAYDYRFCQLVAASGISKGGAWVGLCPTNLPTIKKNIYISTIM